MRKGGRDEGKKGRWGRNEGKKDKEAIGGTSEMRESERDEGKKKEVRKD